jgi:hypothetical protein
LWPAIGDQGMDVLNRQAWIRLVEPYRLAARHRSKVNELLQVFSARGGGRVLGEFEYKIEHFSNILGEIGNVLVERAVIHGKETDLVVLERYELREMGCTHGVQVLSCPAPPRAQEQNCISMKAMRDLVGRITRNGRCSPAPLTSAAAAKALISLAVTSG